MPTYLPPERLKRPTYCVQYWLDLQCLCGRGCYKHDKKVYQMRYMILNEDWKLGVIQCKHFKTRCGDYSKLYQSVELLVRAAVAKGRSDFNQIREDINIPALEAQFGDDSDAVKLFKLCDFFYKCCELQCLQDHSAGKHNNNKNDSNNTNRKPSNHNGSDDEERQDDDINVVSLFGICESMKNIMKVFENTLKDWDKMVILYGLRKINDIEGSVELTLQDIGLSVFANESSIYALCIEVFLKFNQFYNAIACMNFLMGDENGLSAKDRFYYGKLFQNTVKQLRHISQYNTITDLENNTFANNVLEYFDSSQPIEPSALISHINSDNVDLNEVRSTLEKCKNKPDFEQKLVSLLNHLDIVKSIMTVFASISLSDKQDGNVNNNDNMVNMDIDEKESSNSMDVPDHENDNSEKEKSSKDKSKEKDISVSSNGENKNDNTSNEDQLVVQALKKVGEVKENLLKLDDDTSYSDIVSIWIATLCLQMGIESKIPSERHVTIIAALNNVYDESLMKTNINKYYQIGRKLHAAIYQCSKLQHVIYEGQIEVQTILNDFGETHSEESKSIQQCLYKCGLSPNSPAITLLKRLLSIRSSITQNLSMWNAFTTFLEDNVNKYFSLYFEHFKKDAMEQALL